MCNNLIETALVGWSDVFCTSQLKYRRVKYWQMWVLPWSDVFCTSQLKYRRVKYWQMWVLPSSLECRRGSYWQMSVLPSTLECRRGSYWQMPIVFFFGLSAEESHTDICHLFSSSPWVQNMIILTNAKCSLLSIECIRGLYWQMPIVPSSCLSAEEDHIDKCELFPHLAWVQKRIILTNANCSLLSLECIRGSYWQMLVFFPYSSLNVKKKLWQMPVLNPSSLTSNLRKQWNQKDLTLLCS